MNQDEDVLEQAESDNFKKIRDNLGASNDFTERVDELRQEFPHISRVDAEEILDFMSEKGWSSCGKKTTTTSLPAWIARFQKILRYIKNHPNANAIYAVIHIWDEPLLDDINCNLSQSEFADAMYPSKSPINPAKAAVNNAVKDAQRFFNQPPRKDQRSKSACKTMSKATINRLERNK